MSSSGRARPTGRRAFLARGMRAAGALGLWVLLAAHTPYRQWTVYRQRHLLIVASKTDPEGFRLCREEFPAEHAYLVVRAFDENRERLPAKWAAPAGAGDAPLPPHPGALEYLRHR